jgi:integral membrane protein
VRRSSGADLHAIDAALPFAYENGMSSSAPPPAGPDADARAQPTSGKTSHAINRFRLIANLEGVSYLVLLCIAMPLKYYAGLPVAVRIVGMAHGVLFVAYGALVAVLVLRRVWSIGKGAEAMMYSLLPFGTFVLDAKLRREMQGA